MARATGNKLLILDKDGTLVRPASGEKFVQHPKDQKVLSGVKEALARYVADGWTPVVASNQGGVQAGFKSLEDAIMEAAYCTRLLPAIEWALFCPDDGFSCVAVNPKLMARKAHFYEYPLIAKSICDDAHQLMPGRINTCTYTDSKNRYRKPASGMLALAIELISISSVPPGETLFVGDMETDRQAAEAAEVRYMDAEEWRREA